MLTKYLQTGIHFLFLNWTRLNDWYSPLHSFLLCLLWLLFCSHRRTGKPSHDGSWLEISWFRSSRCCWLFEKGEKLQNSWTDLQHIDLYTTHSLTHSLTPNSLQSMLFLVDFQSGSQRIGVTGFCLGGALTLYALATVPGLLKFVLSLLYCECVIDISFFLSSSVSISKSLKMKVRTLIK